jgi:hypothetical protein
MRKRLTKEQVSKLVARELMSLAKGASPAMYRFIPVHPKTEKAATSKGKVSQVDILRMREGILSELRDQQLNY